jgi:putative aminopeptidase FrvX
MEKIKSILNSLVDSFSVSGHELCGKEAIERLASGIFDEIKVDNLGTMLLVKRSGKENARKLLKL